ncbi:hypothetical protein OBJ96_12440 [Empedobacter falsenii]|uniref:GLPGLI family protein n=1 Tax=Empedobacter stercoris TaxID=1628248 RepID=A0ABX1WL34_9FLAO|nr:MULTISPECIES: hypothetical protein [Empedobacter]MCA4778025.1 hypothetical protein [Empedobacter stercoris]MCA4810047.1 hypothetical protein [Empedobacter stercoris]MDM1521926.1 hypothetical protein [Empedobacter sp. 225-1]NOJ75379.1 hypothetical protein [Empedobacter stercoris]QNT15473.1 hypothetical protein HNV03_12875 [Empedobacter stercoris]
MKTIKILILLLFTYNLFAQEKANTFIYKFYNAYDSEKITALSKKGISVKFDDSITYILEQNDSIGTFKAESKLNNSQGTSFDLTEVFIKSQGDFFYDYKNNITLNSKRDYVIKIDENDFTWEIIEDNISCLERICKKAKFTKIEKGVTKDREYTIEVLYDDSYSKNILPFGLLGLKGLIVKINFNGNQEVILEEMKYNKNIKIKPFKDKRKIITQREYNEILNNKMLEMKDRLNLKVVIPS